MAELLYKLKEWLTIPDAAAHLSTCFDEEVAEAEVLQLGLAGSLVLSVQFLNPVDAFPGRVEPCAPTRLKPNGSVRMSDNEILALDKPEDWDDWFRNPWETLGFADCHVHHSAKSEKDQVVVTLEGLWNLSMAESGRTFVEQRLQFIGSSSI